MNPESMQEPVADERTHDAFCRVADEAEPAASDNPARQPSAMTPTIRMTISLWSDRCMLFPFALRNDSWAGKLQRI
jgi:hypothetical protein